jgi:hypothetical protein
MKRGRLERTLRRILFVTVCCASAALGQIDWTSRNAPTPSVNLNAAASSGNMLVVAGDSGVIVSFADTGAWTARTSGTTTAFHGLIGNNTVWVAVGAGGVIRTANGNNPVLWTNRVSGTSSALQAISYSGTRWVAVGQGGIITSSTNAPSNSWAVNNSGTAQTLNTTDFGNNLFVVAGDSGVILTSTTGTSGWTSRTSGTVNPLYRVRWVNNLFVAVGAGGTILTSTNGTTWVSRISGTTRALHGLQRGNNLWVAVGDSGVVLSSTDGSTWASRTSGTTQDLREVAWTNNQFVAVGAQGALLASSDGIQWGNAAPFAGTLNGLTAARGSLYVAVGTGGAVLTAPQAGGSSWTARVSGTTATLAAVDTGVGGLLAAVGAGGTLITSTNGTSWTTRSTGTSQDLHFVRWGGGRFVAVGDAGTILTSATGTAWTLQNSGTTAALHAVEWTGSQYVAAGASGTLLASTDGTFWTPRSSGTTVALRALRWTSDNRLIAVGAGGAIFLSADGASWQAQPTGATADLRALASMSGRIVAVGANGAVISSPNGVTWSSHASGVTAALNAVHGNGSQFAVAGAKGVILTSPASAATAPPAIPSLVTPAQNATGIALNMSLIWTTTGPTGAGGNTYRVQLSTRPDFATLLVDDSTRIGNTISVTNLLANTAYYWRVRSKNNGNAGNSSFWSETGLFTTGALAAPVLSAPAAGATGIASPATLQWGAVTGAQTYRLQVSTSASFATLVLDDSTLTEVSRNAGGLSANTVYYWRVNAKNASGTSAWSSQRSFTTVATLPGTPALRSPASNATAVSVYAWLTWGTVSGAAGYRLQLATDSGFAAPLIHDSLLADTARSAGHLSGSTVHYWRVRAHNLAGAGAWSAIRRFTTGPVPTAPPPAPILSEPAAFSTGISLTPVLSWNAVAEAYRYRVQVSASPNFSGVVADDSSLTGLQKSIASLQGNTEYYWRVSGINAFGSGPWSEIRSFRTVVTAPTEAPFLATPASFATGVAMPVALTWGAVPGAATYRVQVSTTPDFAALVFENTGVAATSVTATGLGGNSDYYWRVAARNTAGTGPNSSIWKFTTGALPPPEMPTLTAPVAFETGVIQGRVMSWTDAALATSYRVQVSLSTGFAANVLDDSTMTTARRTLAGTLQPLTVYYWRVRAKNAAGVSAWTAPWSFTTAAQLPNAVLEGPSLSRVLDARGGLIRFSLPHPGRVTVRLRDTRGRTTALLLDEVLGAGAHVLALPHETERTLRLLELRAGDARKTLILTPSP